MLHQVLLFPSTGVEHVRLAARSPLPAIQCCGPVTYNQHLAASHIPTTPGPFLTLFAVAVFSRTLLTSACSSTRLEMGCIGIEIPASITRSIHLLVQPASTSTTSSATATADLGIAWTSLSLCVLLVGLPTPTWTRNAPTPRD